MSKVDPVGFIPKGWGHEVIVANSEKYCGKILFIAKGRKFSLHYHPVKEEHFYVISGKAILQEGISEKADTDPDSFFQYPIPDVLIRGIPSGIVPIALKESELNPGDIVWMRPNTLHRIIALQDTYIAEFSTQHFEEDSIRVEKGD